MTTVRGIRNNNPLNIEHNPHNEWRGLDDPPTDGRFCRFMEPQWGIRAAILILRKYNQRGISSLRGLISTWAPSHENNVETYLGVVCRETGWTPATIPNLKDKAQTIALLKAMCLVECGPAPEGNANRNWLDDAVYVSGWELAQPLTKSTTIRASAAAAATVAAGVVEVATNHVEQLTTAGVAATTLWPKLAPWVMGFVALCFIGVVVWSRLDTRARGVK